MQNMTEDTCAASNDIQVSVIIPVYNNARYVESALDCVARQGLASYEIIAVNDGSTDGSGQVLDAYAATHDAVRVIHQPNRGVSAARNAALNVAQGTYLAFLDSDDTFCDGSLADMVLIAETRNADLVIGESRSVGEFETTPLYRARYLSKKGIINREDADLAYNFSCCNKLFRRSLVEEHHLRFPTLRHAEDGVFLYSYLCRCGLITGCPRYIYRYVKHLSVVARSTLKQLDISLFESAMEACERIRQMTADWSDTFAQELDARILRITIINEYYRRLWTFDDQTYDAVKSYVDTFVEHVGPERWDDILRLSSDLELGTTIRSRKEIADDPLVSVVVLPGMAESDYLTFLSSLYYQILPNFEVVADASYESLTPESFKVENLHFVSRLETAQDILSQTKGDYLQIVSDPCVYYDTTLQLMWRRLQEQGSDFISVKPVGFINNSCVAYPKADPAFTKPALSEYLREPQKCIDFQQMDSSLTNKFFGRVAFERIASEGTLAISDLLSRCYGALSYRRIDNAILGMMLDEVPPVPRPAKPGAPAKKPLSSRERKKREAYELFAHTLPVNKKKVLFLSDIREEIGGNYLPLKALCEEAGYEVVCRFRGGKNDWLGRRFELGQCYDIATAGYIFLEDFHKDTAYMHVRRGQKLIQLWHACGAFKKFAWSRVGGNENINIHPGYRKYTNAIVSAEAIRENYAEAFDISLDRVGATGIPRTDIFFDQDYACAARERLLQKYPVLQGKKVVLIAPTYRGTTLDKATYAFDQIDPWAIHEALGDDTVLVFKWHPAMIRSMRERKPYDWEAMSSFALDATQERDINDFLLLADVLVTDYSSIIFEWALLDKPIIYHWFDVNEYIIGRGMYYDMDAYVYGQVSYCAEELTQALVNPQVDEEARQRFVDRFMSACDGSSAQHVFDWVFNNVM